jgi:hypothetical protein
MGFINTALRFFFCTGTGKARAVQIMPPAARVPAGCSSCDALSNVEQNVVDLFEGGYIPGGQDVLQGGSLNPLAIGREVSTALQAAGKFGFGLANVVVDVSRTIDGIAETKTAPEKPVLSEKTIESLFKPAYENKDNKILNRVMTDRAYTTNLVKRVKTTIDSKKEEVRASRRSQGKPAEPVSGGGVFSSIYAGVKWAFGKLRSMVSWLVKHWYIGAIIFTIWSAVCLYFDWGKGILKTPFKFLSSLFPFLSGGGDALEGGGDALEGGGLLSMLGSAGSYIYDTVQTGVDKVTEFIDPVGVLGYTPESYDLMDGDFSWCKIGRLFFQTMMYILTGDSSYAPLKIIRDATRGKSILEGFWDAGKCAVKAAGSIAGTAAVATAATGGFGAPVTGAVQRKPPTRWCAPSSATSSRQSFRSSPARLTFRTWKAP